MDPRPHSAPASSSRSSSTRSRRRTSSAATRRRCASSPTRKARASSAASRTSSRISRAAGGLPRQVDARPFTVGSNVAATPGRGRLSQRAPRADPVRADDPRRARAAAGDRAAADQQVLRVRPRGRQEPRALRARGRPADVRRELAQPDAQAVGVGLRCVCGSAGASARGDARDHRLAGRQRARGVLGRHHADRAARPPGRAPRPDRPLGDAGRLRARHVVDPQRDRRTFRDARQRKGGEGRVAETRRRRRQRALRGCSRGCGPTI